MTSLLVEPAVSTDRRFIHHSAAKATVCQSYRMLAAINLHSVYPQVRGGKKTCLARVTHKSIWRHTRCLRAARDVRAPAPDRSSPREVERLDLPRRHPAPPGPHRRPVASRRRQRRAAERRGRATPVPARRGAVPADVGGAGRVSALLATGGRTRCRRGSTLLTF